MSPLCRAGCVLLLLMVVFFVPGCHRAERAPSPEERRVQQAAYQDQLAALPDSVRTEMEGIDSLFVDYDALRLEALRVDTSGAARWVDSTLAALSLEEKIAQLFIVRLPEPGRLRTLTGDEAAQVVEEHGVGGFLVSRVLGPREVFKETQRLQRIAEVPLFFAADYERGAGRFSNAFTELPSNMALGAARDTSLAAAAGRLTALESRAIGVNLLFAPVVDVNNNPDNPIINIRSYGENPAQVGRMAEAFVRAAQAGGLLTTLKHFPGHGDTSIDTHARMGTVTGSRAALDSIELAPYRAVLDDRGPQPAGVMTAHLWIQALDEEPLPATFSRRALTGLLREELGFEGLVLTDDIRMGALQNTYPMTERIVRPLTAGADVILLPNDLEAAIDVVRQAVEEGRLAQEALDRSVRRVLAAKAQAGLHTNRFASEEALSYLLEAPRGEIVAQAIADRAVTLLKTAPVLPLREEQRALLVQLSNYRDSESIDAAMDDFAALLSDTSRLVEERFDGNPSAEEQEDVLAAAAEADVVVLALYLRLTSGRGEAGLFPAQQELARRLVRRDVPVVLAVFGNPYALTAFPEAEAHLLAYDQTLASVYAGARILQGRQPPRGQLPITVAPYAYGSGLGDLRQGRVAAGGADEERPAASGR